MIIITIASLTSVCYAKPLIARLFSRFPAATPISDFAFCRSSDLSIHVRRIFPRTNALLQPSLGAMTALPMTGFHRAQISLHGKQYFRNTATFQILSFSCSCRESRFFPCPGLSPDSLVQLEQECVSVRHCRRCLHRVCVRSGRAFATKAIVCNFRQK